jgi:patatin-like phospholipase
VSKLAVPHTEYSPERRTALVFTGTGTDGAYHAGALRALNEAGVRIDLVAGRGVGAVGALFAAIDGGARLWEATGLWRRPLAAALYPWRRTYRRVAAGATLAALLLIVPPALVGLGMMVYELAVLVGAAYPGSAGWIAGSWGTFFTRAFAPDALPTRLPQLVTAVLAVVIVAVLASALRARMRFVARRDQQGGAWWTLLATPFSGDDTARYFITGLWDLLRGGANVRQPARTDLSRRYAELLSDNLGQPGFRELLFVAHDLDARHDLVFALLGEPWRRGFFAQRGPSEPRSRSGEAIDLAGAPREVLLDGVAASLALPGATDPPFLTFAPESHWRGETHRVTDRPGSLLRVLEEVAHAGARQVILVTAAEEIGGPHALSVRRAAPRGRLGEYFASAEAATVRDALGAAAGWFDAMFVIRPPHNPVSPLDADGAFDARSDRWQTVGELVDRGYEDAYRQFIDPVVGASGERMANESAIRNPQSAIT